MTLAVFEWRLCRTCEMSVLHGGYKRQCNGCGNFEAEPGVYFDIVIGTDPADLRREAVAADTIDTADAIDSRVDELERAAIELRACLQQSRVSTDLARVEAKEWKRRAIVATEAVPLPMGGAEHLRAAVRELGDVVLDRAARVLGRLPW